MYLRDRDLCILEIPKTGTNTLRDAIAPRSLPGHLTAQQVTDWLGHEPEFWALIREPWSRLTSQMNFVYGDTTVSLDDAMNGAARHETIVFKPQAHFITDNTRLWRFEDMGKMLAEMGISAFKHKNKSVARWTTAEIRAHPRADDVISRAAADFDLWRRANEQASA